MSKIRPKKGHVDIQKILIKENLTEKNIVDKANKS